MIKMLNTLSRVSRLGPELQNRVRAKEEGLFKNTIIRDGDTAYGYDREGKVYLCDADDIMEVGRFLWKQDEQGYMIAVNVETPYGRCMRMEELLMGMWEV